MNALIAQRAPLEQNNPADQPLIHNTAGGGGPDNSITDLSEGAAVTDNVLSLGGAPLSYTANAEHLVPVKRLKSILAAKFFDVALMSENQSRQPVTFFYDGGRGIFAGAGDNSSSDGGRSRADVDLPSPSPNVTGCGGAREARNGAETVWNDEPGGRTARAQAADSPGPHALRSLIHLLQITMPLMVHGFRYEVRRTSSRTRFNALTGGGRFPYVVDEG